MKQRLLGEYSHFKKLHTDARRLLFSSTVYEIALPLLVIFVNLFILDRTSGYLGVTVYNAGMFVSTPVIFWLNGWLLKKISIKTLYSLGLVGQGLSVMAVLFLSQVSTWWLLLFGLFQGIPIGMYWANRNFLSLEMTHDDNRNYYVGLETTVALLAGIIFPFLYGSLLQWSRSSQTFSIDSMYQVLIIIVTLFLGFGGMVVMKSNVENPDIGSVFVKQVTSLWWYQRLIEVFRGLMNGLLFFFPTLLLLEMGGKEGALGVVQTVSAVFSSALAYSIGRKMKSKQRVMLMSGITILWLILLFPLTVTPHAIVRLLFIIGMPVLEAIVWLVLNPIAMKAIDSHTSGDLTQKYAYVADREFFLNIGRLLGLFGFLLLVFGISEEIALQFTPVMMMLSQIGVWYGSKRVSQS